MQYQKIPNELNFRFESKNFLSIFGLYLFSLGAILSGYSLYLLLESVGRTERIIISWTGQGLFWFLILFLISIFILFIPVEFLNVFRVYNSSFKDLIINIIYSIFISLFFLILFQYSINLETLILNDISSIGKAVSFSGFISVPIILFLLHSLRNTVKLLDRFSYSFVLLTWILSSQLFI
ncbi:MAG: hypothetical protein EVA29_00680 [Candidatus Actinomarinales bacterium]|nr:MAG: hypothetical protein EVA29_00680 [Candidatus Actinomarinales bacterium]|tara:strand:- start:236 stop:775 length:540 start_codon:yes stop_codon:yes gene_type:complete